jgi:MFS family permease
MYILRTTSHLPLQNISTNLGGFLSPLIVGYLAKHYGHFLCMALLPDQPCSSDAAVLITNKPQLLASIVMYPFVPDIPHYTLFLCAPCMQLCSHFPFFTSLPSQQNISTNLGGFLSPLIVGYLAKHYGWQWGLMAPGMFGLAAGTLLLFALADKPEDTGGLLCFFGSYSFEVDCMFSWDCCYCSHWQIDQKILVSCLVWWYSRAAAHLIVSLL